MSILIGIALKSLLIAGLTLGLLKLLAKRSAAERSWVAHIGLFALVIMAFAPIVLPAWNVEAPALLSASAEPAAVAQPLVTPSAAPHASTSAVATMPVAAKPAPATLSPLAAATALYAVPAAILLFLTALALVRLSPSRPAPTCWSTATG